MFRNKSLAALFTLAILGGFTMFSLLFYAPLLFQGGFGMSPKDAGLMITPLVVFITIGSIVNGRIVTRVKNPNRDAVRRLRAARAGVPWRRDRHARDAASRC